MLQHGPPSFPSIFIPSLSILFFFFAALLHCIRVKLVKRFCRQRFIEKLSSFYS